MVFDKNSISPLIFNVHLMLKWKVQEALKDFDITSEQWIILGRLDKKRGEYNQKELAKDTNKEQASITRIIDKLEKKGFVERTRSEKDRRQYIIHITDKGRAYYQSTLPNMREEEKAVDNLITAKEKEELLRILQKMYDKLQKE